MGTSTTHPFQAVVQSEGRIRIPHPIRKEENIEVGDFVEVELKDVRKKHVD